MRVVLGALVLAAAMTGVARAHADDDGTTVTEKKCRLAKGRVGSVEVSVQREDCGSGGCGHDEGIAVFDKNEETLLFLTNHVCDLTSCGDFRQFSASCDGDGVVLKEKDVEVLKLAYVRKRRQLEVPGAVIRKIEDGWTAPPARGDAAAERERLVQLFDALLPRNPKDSQVTPPRIAGLDRGLAQSLWLLIARDKIEAGIWETAQFDLRWVAEDTVAPAGAVARRHDELVKRLAALRAQSVPMVVAEQHRIGTTPTWPAFPVAPDFVPTVFWRGESVCVTQEDRKPPTEMRCLDAVTRKWGAREPLARPRSSGERLLRLSYPEVNRCDPDYVVQKSVFREGGPDACSGGPGEKLEELVAVVDGDAMLLAGEQGLRVNRGAQKNEPLTWQTASALLAQSAGTVLVGNGCCRFEPDGRLVRLGPNAKQQRWEIRGPLPKEQAWTNMILVSPSGSWAVSVSHISMLPPAILWLLRLAPKR